MDTTWMKIKIVMMDGRSQTKDSAYGMISFI